VSDGSGENGCTRSAALLHLCSSEVRLHRGLSSYTSIPTSCSNHSQTTYTVRESDLEHLSPILSGHINLHGSYHFDLQASKKRQWQLPPYEPQHRCSDIELSVVPGTSHSEFLGA
jgi:hypothetical protein